ncbi:MAG TPA: DUF3576 domain-containing protein [Stellaceae bacterium]|nr:DUF3576 domain-containing protein [Stellaceae bacterium]
MPIAYYRLPLALTASLSLLLAACAHQPSQEAAVPVPHKPAPRPAGIDTDATIWTLLGIAKKKPPPGFGPQIGSRVSPVLWKAAHDTLDFVPIDSEDPMTGALATEWYSPPDKPDERFKIAVYVLSRALRSSSLAVQVKRQTRSPEGGWVDAPVDSKVDTDLEAAILNRARQIWHAHIVKEM